MSQLVEIIIPTYNNPAYARPCLTSLLENQATKGLFHITVVNNGHPQSCDWIAPDHPQVSVINPESNLGWEGGLKLGLENTSAPFVCFLNDDTFIPPGSRHWLTQLLQALRSDKVAAVGPGSNTVMGPQNVFQSFPYHRFTATYLIGFCLLVRRSTLEEVGGVDDTLPGGDDLDLSIRLRQAGYELAVDREVFVYHHGFKTGERLYGDSSTGGGWNSYEQYSATNTALIRKHGFKAWWECISGAWSTTPANRNLVQAQEDIEGSLIRDRVIGETVLDLGCGGNKTVPHAIGVDMVPIGDVVTTLTGNPSSAADVTADVSEPLPFDEGYADTVIARHILEHMLDPLTTLRQWAKVLKPGGRLIVAVPNQALLSSIPMNIEHVHAWDPPALKTLLEAAGLTISEQLDAQNNISFITVAEKGAN